MMALDSVSAWHRWMTCRHERMVFMRNDHDIILNRSEWQCPECGMRELRLGFVVDEPDSEGGETD